MSENPIEKLLKRFPELNCIQSIKNAYQEIISCYDNNNKLMVCGNGGSAADGDHIAGELLKSFEKMRPLKEETKKNLIQNYGHSGKELADNLQQSLPVINLSSQMSIITAIANDIGCEYIFAQQVLGYGNNNDILIGISTSGNSKNVLNALKVAKNLKMTNIGFTGENGGQMNDLCDILIKVPANSTAEVQELHLPVYHCLCAMIENHYF